DYVRAMHLMVQRDEPEDLVVASGESHSVQEFCELAFAEVGLDYRDYVIQDEKFYRPAEVEHLIGDSSKAREALGWEPQYTFKELVKEMIHRDLELVDKVTEIAAAPNIKTPNTNAEVRKWYLHEVATIPRLNNDWIELGLSTEERAKAAWSIRHEVRARARAMMADPAEAELL